MNDFVKAKCPYCEKETSFHLKRELVRTDSITIAGKISAVCCDECNTVVTFIDEDLHNNVKTAITIAKG